MKIQQAYVSRGVAHFADRFRSNYGLLPYTNPDEPAVFFGMYYDQDYITLLNHTGASMIVWCGIDSAVISTRGKFIIEKSGAVSIASLAGIHKNLKSCGIPFRIARVTAADLTLKPVPRGDMLYHYGDGTAKYGEQHLEEIEQKTGIGIIRMKSLQMPYAEFMSTRPYDNAFLCLGLSHTGSGTTMAEMGLMGRASINNGHLPHSIKYKNTADVIKAVKREYERRHQPNERIHRDIYQYLNTGDQWLQI